MMRTSISAVLILFAAPIAYASESSNEARLPDGYFSYARCSPKGWLSVDSLASGYGKSAKDAELLTQQNAAPIGDACLRSLQIISTEPYYHSEKPYICYAACKTYSIFGAFQESTLTRGAPGFNQAAAEYNALSALIGKMKHHSRFCESTETRIIRCMQEK